MTIHTPRPPSKPRDVWGFGSLQTSLEQYQQEKNATNSSTYSIDTESSCSSFSSSQLDNIFADDFKIVREDKDKSAATAAAKSVSYLGGECGERMGDTTVDFSDLLFESVCSEIRAMNVLSSYQMHYVGTLSTDKLRKIIELYNVVIRNVNDIL